MSNGDEPLWVDFVAGWVGGCFGLLAGHPMDTIKVRQQAVGNVSVVDGIAKTFKYEGVRGFYKGMGSPLVATGALNSLFFGVYSNAIRKLAEGKDRPSYLDIFNAGCAGGVVQLAVACPVDVVKIKMQIQTEGDAAAWGKNRKSQVKRYSGPTRCLIDMYKAGGIRSWYHGLGSTALRDIPTFGLYMVIFEAFIRNLAGHEDNAGPLTLMFSGGMAGALSWATIVPVDTIKSRVQADNREKPQYKNFYDCCLKSYRAEGITVFWRGFAMVIARAFPTNATIFLAYVSCNNLIKATLSERNIEEFC